MRRRDLILAGAVGLAGCTDLSTSGPGGTTQSGQPTDTSGRTDKASTPTLSPSVTQSPTPDRGREELSIGAAYTTSGGLEIRVSRLEIGRSITYEQDRATQPSEGGIFLFAEVSVSNTGEGVQRAPPASEWSALSGDDQYDSSRFYSDVELAAPVSGSPYEGGEIHPDVTRDGWVMFEIPKSVTTVTVAVTNWDVFDIEGIYWQGEIDTSTLPDVALNEVSMPTEVELGKELTFTFTAKNSGGSRGSFTVDYELDLPDGLPSSVESATIEVDGDATATKTVTVMPEQLGEVKLTVAGRTYTTTVVLPTRSFGESWTDPTGVQTVMGELVLSATYSYPGFNREETVEASDGMQFLFVHATFENTGSEPASTPFGNKIQALIGGSKYEFTVPEFFGDAKYSKPIDGKPFRAGFGFDLAPNEQHEAWLLFEVPGGAQRTDISIRYQTTNQDGQKGAIWE